MDKNQMIDRLLSLMRQMSKQYTEEEAQELSNLYVECLTQEDFPAECTDSLGRALEQERPGLMFPLMGQAVKALRDMTNEKPAVHSMEVDDEKKEEDVDNKKSHQAVKTSPSSRTPKKKDNKEKDERFPWVRGIKAKNGGQQLRPTQQQTELMRETLTGVYENWKDEDDMSWTQPLPDEEMKLITFQSEGRTCCLLRHVMLYMCIVYNVFVAWEHILDRNRRRRLLLMADVGDRRYEEARTLREELAVVPIHTNQDTTALGLLDDYERPLDSRKNKDKKKVLLVVLEGSTAEQIQKSPAVRCNLQEVLSFKEYFELLMRKLLPSQAAPRREFAPDTEAVPVTVTKNPPKKKKKNESEATKKELKLPTNILVIRNDNLSRMVEYCETMLSSSMMEWFGNTVLELQEKRDVDLLAKLEKETPEHDGLFKVHNSCNNKGDGEEQCEHLLMGRVKCRHGRCDVLDCNRCPLLIRNYWYLMNLADTIDFKKEKEQPEDHDDVATCFLKSKRQCEEDIIKVHKFKNTTQVGTVQNRLRSLRQFLEWYIVNIHDLLGRDAFHDSQPTLIGLFHSSQLPKLLTKWHQTLDAVNRQTSRNKLKDVIDVIECNVEYFHNWCLPSTDDPIVLKLKKRFEGNIKALYAHLPKIAGAGARVQMQTNARLSSTDEGKAPPIQRVFDAHNFLRTGLWDKLKCCRGKADAHRLPQMVLLLAFIKLLMGARAGMLSHIAIGKNLKTIGWVRYDETVEHQTPNKDNGDDGKLDSYVKGYAIKYMREIVRRVPKEQESELRYYVVLLALRKSWYGYKNGHINARIVPFHREMSMEIIVFAASILYIRKETSDEVASLAAKFLEHYQTTRFNTTEAYKWLDDNDKVDFLKLVNDQLNGPIRVFYKTADDDKYGSHAIHHRGTSDTAMVEKRLSDSVTKMLKEAMRTYYASVDVKVDELTDGSREVKQLDLLALKYHHRGARSATADYISRLLPFMPEDIKKMLVEQTLMHTLETHNEVYIKDMKYMRCVALRSWMERGAPQAEWDDVERTTMHQMAVGEEDKVTFEAPPSDVQDMCILGQEDVKDEEPESTSSASGKQRKRWKGLLPGSSASHTVVEEDVKDEVQSQKRKIDFGRKDDMSQAPPTSQSKRNRTDKFKPVRYSLFTDVGFDEHRLVKVDCCTYKVHERKHPSATDPTGGYVWLVWESCPETSCNKKRRAAITLEDSNAQTYLDRLKFISDDGEKEEQWAGERFSTPLT